MSYIPSTQERGLIRKRNIFSEWWNSQKSRGKRNKLRINETMRYGTENELSKANIICDHWMRITTSSSSYSWQFLIDIVLRYYPLLVFQWDSKRKHDNLRLSNDNKMFTNNPLRQNGNPYKPRLYYPLQGDSASLCAMNMLSGDTVSAVRWEVTFKQKNDWWPVEFTMGFIDSQYIDEFRVDRRVGTAPHEAALVVKESVERKDAVGIYERGVFRYAEMVDADAEASSPKSHYAMPPNLRIELHFDFKKRQCIALMDGKVRETVTTKLPHTIHLAASVRGPGCSFETTLFEESNITL